MMTVPHVCTHTLGKFRTYVRQGVEIIKGAWRARGYPDDGHVNQDGRPRRVPLFATVICYRPFYFNDFHACVKRFAAVPGKGCYAS